MNGPSEELRREIRSRIDEIFDNQPNALRNVTPQSEERLEGILNDIIIALEADSDAVGERDDAQDLLNATNEWAGLLSYAVSRVYAPASPWPFGLGGWGRGPVRALQSGAGKLQKPLVKAATALGANGFSVSTGFPWGVSVGLSWPIPPVSPGDPVIASSTQNPVTASSTQNPVKDQAERMRDRRQKMGKHQVEIPDAPPQAGLAGRT